MERTLHGTLELVPFQANESILMYINSQYEDYDIHWHTAAEIIMPLQNDYQVTIGSHVFRLEENDILFIPPGTLHSLQSPPSGHRMIFLFNFSMISSMQDFSALIPVLSQPLLISKNYGQVHEDAVRLMQQMIDIYPDRSEPLRVAMIFSYLIQFFVLLGRQHIRKDALQDVKSRKQTDYFDRLNASMNYINTHYMNDISIEDAAKIAGFSKFHFSRLFKQFTDQTFCGYLNQRRIKAAESLLLNPRLSITDVALQSGFSSLSTFNRSFRTVKECTPSEYKAYYQRKGMRTKKNLPGEPVASSNDVEAIPHNGVETVPSEDIPGTP